MCHFWQKCIIWPFLFLLLRHHWWSYLKSRPSASSPVRSLERSQWRQKKVIFLTLSFLWGVTYKWRHAIIVHYRSCHHKILDHLFSWRNSWRTPHVYRLLWLFKKVKSFYQSKNFLWMLKLSRSLVQSSIKVCRIQIPMSRPMSILRSISYVIS